MSGAPWQHHRPLVQPLPVAFVGAIGIMMLVPALLLGLIPSGLTDPGPKPLVPRIAVVLFAVGWLLSGATLRPGGSAVRGLSLAALLYVASGVAWVLAFNLRRGVPLGSLASDLVNPTGLGIVLIWPLQMAQVFGLFGLGMA